MKSAHRITAEIHPSYNIPTHHFYKGNNPSGKTIGPVTSYHLKYSFTLPGTYQGIGLSINSFNGREIIGSPVVLYIFQGARLIDFSRKWSLGYEWNLGISYGWKQTDVIQSQSNIYINVGLPFTWRPSQQWEIHTGPEYTHFSNGDTMYPNGGANPVGLRFGATYIIGHDESKSIGKELFSSEADMNVRRFNYDLFLYGAWRAARVMDGHTLHLLNRKFALGGLSFNPLYRLNRHFLAGPSLDIQTDTSTGLDYTEGDNDNPSCLSSPGLWKQTSFGLSIRGELEMPLFSINLGIGYNVIRNVSDIKSFYSTYSLKTFVGRKMFISIGYRLSAAQYTHNLMFGMGFRL